MPLPLKVQPLTKRKAWNAVAAHSEEARCSHLTLPEHPRIGGIPALGD